MFELSFYFFFQETWELQYYISDYIKIPLCIFLRAINSWQLRGFLPFSLLLITE